MREVTSSGDEGSAYAAIVERAQVLKQLMASQEREAVLEGAAKNNGKCVLTRTRGGVIVWAEVLTTAEMLQLIDTGVEITWTSEPAPLSTQRYQH